MATDLTMIYYHKDVIVQLNFIRIPNHKFSNFTNSQIKKDIKNGALVNFFITYLFLSHTCNGRWNQEGHLVCFQRHSGVSTFGASQLNPAVTPNDL